MPLSGKNCRYKRIIGIRLKRDIGQRSRKLNPEAKQAILNRFQEGKTAENAKNTTPRQPFCKPYLLPDQIGTGRINDLKRVPGCCVNLQHTVFNSIDVGFLSWSFFCAVYDLQVDPKNLLICSGSPSVCYFFIRYAKFDYKTPILK